MKKSTFWSDASRGGAIIGLASIVFTTAGILLPKLGGLCSFVSVVVLIYLLFYFTRRRAALYTQEGFTYGQSLGFIAAMSIFVGIIVGAYQIVASNWLFTAHFEEAYQLLMTTLAQAGLSNEEMDMTVKMYRSMLFSPMPALIWSIIGSIIGNCFYGLFISIATKREPDMFESADEE